MMIYVIYYFVIIIISTTRNHTIITISSGDINYASNKDYIVIHHIT
jgi:hypothetical protein